MKINKTLTLIIASILSLSACNTTTSPPLPILGQIDIVDGDTMYHKVPSFEFMAQDSSKIDNQALAPYVYITDFFFMSCPSICPKVKKQMLRIYKRYVDENLLKLVSYTLDPKRDTPERLNQYAQNLGVDNSKWLFLHGGQDEVLDLADDYFVSALIDPDAPGGFDHSGKILLVDKKGHIRAFAEGTDPDDVTDFFNDIDKLLDEYEQQ